MRTSDGSLGRGLRPTYKTAPGREGRGDVELEDAEPLRDSAFKAPLARNAVVRTLLDLSKER